MQQKYATLIANSKKQFQYYLKDFVFVLFEYRIEKSAMDVSSENSNMKILRTVLNILLQQL